MPRVLYMNFASSPGSLATDHTYGFGLPFFLKWIEKEPNLIVYWPIPRNALKEQREAFYKVEHLIDKNFKFFEVDANYQQVLEQATLQSEILKMFSVDDGKYYFDYLFCEKPGVLGLFVGG